MSPDEIERTASFPVSTCGTPALRKYFDTMMSVASCDHVAGTSASSMWKTTDPSGFEIFEDRRTQSTEAKGSRPAVVNLRVIFMTSPSIPSANHGVDLGCTVSVPKPLLLRE